MCLVSVSCARYKHHSIRPDLLDFLLLMPMSNFLHSQKKLQIDHDSSTHSCGFLKWLIICVKVISGPSVLFG